MIMPHYFTGNRDKHYALQVSAELRGLILLDAFCDVVASNALPGKLILTLPNREVRFIKKIPWNNNIGSGGPNPATEVLGIGSVIGEFGSFYGFGKTTEN